ncbi:MAG: universal stress protein [candidate division WOR-3 bacterium]|jgi:nucleotide-binding universal stress UspA family protein
MFSRILLAYDGSDGAKLALEKALELASQMKSKLFVLSVGRIPEYAGSISEIEEAKYQAQKYYSKMLNEVSERAKEKGIDVETIIRYGKPGDVIVDVANEIGADLIVIGIKKHHPLRRRLLGATADKVVDFANCSVLVVR